MFDATAKEKKKEKERASDRRRGEKKANYVPNMWYSVNWMAFDAFQLWPNGLCASIV